MMPVETTIRLLQQLSVIPCLVTRRTRRGAPYWALAFHKHYDETGRRRKGTAYLGRLNGLEVAAIKELLQRANTAMDTLRAGIPRPANCRLRFRERQVRRAANYSVSAAALRIMTGESRGGNT